MFVKYKQIYFEFIGKTYKIQIKAYKTNGAISEIEVKENEMETNLIEENA